jgi:hypothetical protein
MQADDALVHTAQIIIPEPEKYIFFLSQVFKGTVSPDTGSVLGTINLNLYFL